MGALLCLSTSTGSSSLCMPEIIAEWHIHEKRIIQESTHDSGNKIFHCPMFVIVCQGVRERLPSFPKFQPFAKAWFSKSNCLQKILKVNKINFNGAYGKFQQYKRTIPSYGAVLFNRNLDKILLVSSYNSKSFSFPRGKVNEQETPYDCAVREVYEETSFDIKRFLSEPSLQHHGVKVVAGKTFKFRSKEGKKIELFIVYNVPEQFNFKPIVRKEIGKVKWFTISQLRGVTPVEKVRFWLVDCFVSDIMIWVKSMNKKRIREQSYSGFIFDVEAIRMAMRQHLTFRAAQA
eukprot:augustus_masked-scaffold_1-processed-gene-21.11-mRNA-1 protein AED:0.37 eAED:0.37 QI:0/0/0/0.33/1/1/3/0/289